MPSPIGPDPIRPQQAHGAAWARAEGMRPGRGTASPGPEAVGEEAPRPGAEQPEPERVAVPSGMTRETLPDGETRVGLPTGHLLVHRPGEEPFVLGPEGERLPAQHQEGDGMYGFVDGAGNQVLLQPSEMAFAVRNAAGTVTQQVHSSGTQAIEATMTYRQRGTGRTQEVTQRVLVDPEGRIQQESQLPGGVRVAPDGMEFGTGGARLDLPYRIPQDLQGPAAAPPRAEAPPQRPPATEAPPAAPDVLFEAPPEEPAPAAPPQGEPPPYGAEAPGMPPGYGPGAPGMPPGYGPAGPQAPDPFAPVQAPSGLIRQRTPEGMLMISLPNGIVMSQAPDGSATAFDARAEGPSPVLVRPRPRPDGTAELQYDFVDAVGNRYTMFSESQDFAVTSADGRTRQMVLPQGNILLGFRGQDGRSHRLEMLPNGGVNTFGEVGVSLSPDRIVFGASSPPELVPMPYPVPAFQGMIGGMRPLDTPRPTSGLVPPEFAGASATGSGMPPGPGMPPGYGMPPGFDASMPQGMPPGYGMPPGFDASMPQGMPPGYGMPPGMPPGYGMPPGMPPGYGMPPGVPPMGAPAPGFPPAYPGAPPAGGPASEAASPLSPCPGEPQQPVKPGLWQRIKNFFSDDEHPRSHGMPGPYPCQRHSWRHDPWTGLAVASVAMTALNTAMLASTMMYPMGMFYTPFVPFGGACWWR